MIYMNYITNISKIKKLYKLLDDLTPLKDDIINKKENEIMSKKMVIEGMMCGHCEARVKKVLEDTTGVSEAIVSHEAGTAVVTCDESVTSDVLKSVVEDAGYTVVSVD